MTHDKWFRVLVMGGALVAAGCDGDDGTPEGDRAAPDAAGPVVDAATAGDLGSVADDLGSLATDDLGAGPTECGFCPNEECCETQPDGSSQEREGLVCCWGTSC